MLDTPTRSIPSRHTPFRGTPSTAGHRNTHVIHAPIETLPRGAALFESIMATPSTMADITEAVRNFTTR